MSADCSTLGEDPESHPCPPLGLRILSHPDMRRVGEWSALFTATEGGELELCRHAPRFSGANGEDRGALHTRHVSRAGPRLSRRAGERAVLLSAHAGHAALSVDGRPCTGERVLSPEQLCAGVVLTLGRSVTLWLGELDVAGPNIEGFVGVSAAAFTLKRRLIELARLSAPVLIVGEAGSGKQQAARLLHALGPRSAEPFTALGAARLSPQPAPGGLLAPALLDAAPRLLPPAAGTLFLAELAALSASAQTELLHALDEQRGQARPDVAGGARVIASTETDPDSVNGSGPLKRALIDRFPHVLRIPPLRARRQDIALLFASFLQTAMAEHGAQQRLVASDDAADALVPARFVSALVRSHWAGNVRQLQNLALEFAFDNHAATPGQVARWCAERAAEPSTSDAEPASTAQVPAHALSDDDIRAALVATRYNISRAAKRLGVSRAWLHPRIKRSGLLPRAKELAPDVISRALAECNFDVPRAADLLCVSKHGLLLRMHDLGLTAAGKPVR